MARTLYGHVEVGRRVYVSYRPSQAGVITEVIPGKQRQMKQKVGPDLTYTPPPNVRVRWLSGVVTEVPSLALSDFDALIEDHEKKLSTHLATREKLEDLARTFGACAVPPPGWSCSREPGHEGPCAASPKEAQCEGRES